MKTRTLLATIGILPAAACAGGPSAAPGPDAGPTTSLAYGVPSPPTALYHIEDSLVVDVSTPVGDMEVTTTMALTMNMVFGSDRTGIAAVGTVVGFNTLSTNSLTGARSADANDMSGPLALVLSRRGHVEIGAMPSLDSAVVNLSPFPGVAFDIFPRLPGRPVARGATWLDTVMWSVVDETSESATRTIYTYTLMGDTLVDGTTLLNIAVEGDIAMQTVEGVGDTRVDTRLAGSATGYVLWDPERSLPKYSSLHRELEGTNQMPGAGSVRMRITRHVRVRAGY